MGRKKWLAAGPLATRKLHAEAFEITEYGHQPSEEEIRKPFPFFPDRWRFVCAVLHVLLASAWPLRRSP